MTTDVWVSLMPRYAYKVNQYGVVRTLDDQYVEPLETGSYWLQCAVADHQTLWTGDDLFELFQVKTGYEDEHFRSA